VPAPNREPAASSDREPATQPKTDRVLLGILTPSSNTRLEPLTVALLNGLPEVTAHFSRFRVVDVGLEAVGQFDLAPILEAASLLADARVDAIVWSGTSGAWQGIAADRELCAAITRSCGVPATTSTLALLDAVTRSHVASLGLVTPYPDDMHRTVARTLTAAGAPVTASRNHFVTASNWGLSTITGDALTAIVGELAAESPDAITTFCTNLAAADLVPEWEARWGVPVYDSVSLGVWRVLQLAGVDAGRVRGWGRLFDLP
jgi:maleate isomerase